ncbi:uncharacterized protein PpBr36_10926 [Pyricularia pennisetigena]|uniref:Arylesterase/monooxygenase n=1 Tax=Pyricularia oryzae (strain P131) TaxID=1143193 RepID=L7IRQ2_PYRO1|nr:uncharacterized protein PpBr36_10926 [Pyricularia pennisetigena]TLS20791.1 hypothetical protein PpBr36_10926 [Pyricularia pennisetigena]
MASRAPIRRVDPELGLIWEGAPNMDTLSDVPAVRDAFASHYPDIFGLPHLPVSTQRPSHNVKSADGTQIKVMHFIPDAPAGIDAPPARAVIFCFGGGFIMGKADSNIDFAANMAIQTHSHVFMPNYRLAPEHPAPAAVEDVYATLRWVQTHAAGLGINAERVVLFGVSAGGGIATGTALMAYDKSLTSSEKLPLPAGLALRYPMLDDRTFGSIEDPEHFYHVWNCVVNEIAWTAYAGGKARAERTNDTISVYAAPARAGPDKLRGLPPTFVDVGGLDLFREEITKFVTALATAGVDVEFHHYSGLPHGVEMMAPGISKAIAMNKNTCRFIGRF